MAQDSMQGLINTTLENMRGVMDTDTIIGEAIKAPDGTVIVPVAKMSIGFGTGGHAGGKKEGSFAGGAGGGATVKPVGFLVCTPDSGVRFLTVDGNNNLPDRIIDLMPTVLNKIQDLVAKIRGKDSCEKNYSESDE